MPIRPAVAEEANPAATPTRQTRSRSTVCLRPQEAVRSLLTIFNIEHRALTQEHVYRLDTGRAVIGIGALSYTGRLHIYDYWDTMPAGQEPGYIETGRCCSLGDEVTMHFYGATITGT